jgi:hypothetical protein
MKSKSLQEQNDLSFVGFIPQSNVTEAQSFV